MIHPGAMDKTAGKYWPILNIHQNLLVQVLPSLIKTHHAIAFFDHDYHDTNDDLDQSIKKDLIEMV